MQNKHSVVVISLEQAGTERGGGGGNRERERERERERKIERERDFETLLIKQQI